MRIRLAAVVIPVLLVLASCASSTETSSGDPAAIEPVPVVADTSLTANESNDCALYLSVVAGLTPSVGDTLEAVAPLFDQLSNSDVLLGLLADRDTLDSLVDTFDSVESRMREARLILPSAPAQLRLLDDAFAGGLRAYEEAYGTLGDAFRQFRLGNLDETNEMISRAVVHLGTGNDLIAEATDRIPSDGC